MRIATLSDIHANLHALEAVVRAIAADGPDLVYCLGDLAGYGAYPNEVIELIRAQNWPTVMGNYDDGVGFDREDCGCAYTDEGSRRRGDLSLRWTRQQVTPANKAFLRTLLPGVRLGPPHDRVLLVHGSPRRINEYVYSTRTPASLDRIAQSANAEVLVMGHTHLPFVKQVGHVLFVNDGSVGKPKDGDPRATYALLDIDVTVQATIRRVEYPVAAAAEAVRKSGLPSHFADALEAGQG